MKVYPDLAAAAIRNNEATQYRLWLVLRDLSARRLGAWVQVDELRQRFEDLTGGCTDRHWRRLLARGEGSWWRLHRDRVYLVGLVNVCKRLDTRAGQPIEVDPRSFRKLVRAG